MKKIIVLNMFSMFLMGCGLERSETPILKFSDKPRFLIAGQSNSVSRADQHPAHYSSTGLVQINDIYTATPTELFVPTPSRPSMAGVAWIYLGDKLNREVTFRLVGEGNTTSRYWKSTLYQRIQNALLNENFDAILWVQGESDIMEGIPEQETYENMRFIILESRKVRAGIKWFVALDSNKGLPDDNRVRRAQRRIIAEGLAFAGPDVDPIHNNPAYTDASGGDFAGDGLRVHGELWYEVLKNGFN